MSAAPGLLALGWDDAWLSAWAELRDPTLWPARVSRVDRGMCTVMTGSAELRVTFQRGMEPAVGDWVGVRRATPDGSDHIVSVLPRRGVFRRAAGARGTELKVVAANIDTVFLCDALDGRLGLRHLERFVALVWRGGATPVVVITKSDALDPQVGSEAFEAVKAATDGVDVVAVSAATGEGMQQLAPYLVPRTTVALIGLSGAGKSTLVNRLAGARVLATGEVRRDGSGRHTTTHRELVLLPHGGLLIDTPGMRALSVLGASGGVELAFRDLELLALGCTYTSCSHQDESGCALNAAHSAGNLDRNRLDSWLRLTSEAAPSEREGAAADIAERKRRKAAKFAGRRQART